MVLFPHAKINLGLQVTGKRHDGYHEIASCLFPIQWCDILELIEADNLQFTASGLPIPGKHQDNLCLKAYQLLKTSFDIPAVHIHLHKVIPIGAGLGGGSADAAFTLVALNRLFDLRVSRHQLRTMAAEIGSDCPFFIEGATALAQGKGSELAPIEVSLPPGFLVVIKPPVTVSTAEAYAGITPKIPERMLTDILTKEPISQWRSLLNNDFEDLVFRKYPEVAKIKDLLYQRGALFASLSGSGSSIFGIFSHKPDCKDWFDQDHIVWQQPI